MRLAFLFASLCSAQSFYGVGALGFASTTPHPSAFWVVAVPLTQNRQVWSFTETDAQLVGRPLAVQTSTRSGFATPCKTMGPVEVFCLGDAGAATAGASVSAAFAAGAVAIIPLGKKLKGWYLMPGFRVIEITNPVPGGKTTTRLLELAIGRSQAK